MASSYMYRKRCKVCQTSYWDKDISEMQFDMLQENPNITIKYEGDVGVAEIQSVCSKDAEEYYRVVDNI